jgi:hypothetical protein
MKPTREYVSPDNQLSFVVDHDEQDVRLGFEGLRLMCQRESLSEEHRLCTAEVRVRISSAPLQKAVFCRINVAKEE